MCLHSFTQCKVCASDTHPQRNCYNGIYTVIRWISCIMHLSLLILWGWGEGCRHEVGIWYLGWSQSGIWSCKEAPGLRNLTLRKRCLVIQFGHGYKVCLSQRKLEGKVNFYLFSSLFIWHWRLPSNQMLSILIKFSTSSIHLIVKLIEIKFHPKSQYSFMLNGASENFFVFDTLIDVSLPNVAILTNPHPPPPLVGFTLISA